MSDVIVVGAGAAGLVCAADLQQAGLGVTVIEAGDDVGGRVRSDQIDGFVLDRGFQILLTAYPQVKQRLDTERLQLGYFAPGALVRTATGESRLANPLRRPQDLPATVGSKVGTAADKLRMAALIADVTLTPARRLLRRRDTSTLQRLKHFGFSSEFIDLFWRPFFSGIQLDPELAVSARRFDIVLRMLALGRTGLPAAGIGMVSTQLAERVPTTSLRLGTRVASVEPGAVTLEGGEKLTANAIVVATQGPEAHRLMPDAVADPGSRPVAALWFAAPPRTDPDPFLMLDGTGSGPAVNVVPVSEVQPRYAPPGRALWVAAVPGPQAHAGNLPQLVADQLARWLALSSRELELIRCDVIEHGQPLQTPPLAVRRRVDLGGGLFVCGDHRDTASLQGAMFSGQRTAESVLAHLRAGPVSG